MRDAGGEGEREDAHGPARLGQIWPVFSLAFLVGFLFLTSHPPLITTLLLCFVDQKLKSFKKTSTTLIVTFSNVYVLLSFALLSSPLSCPLVTLYFLDYSSAYSTSTLPLLCLLIILCCCSDIHTKILALHGK